MCGLPRGCCCSPVPNECQVSVRRPYLAVLEPALLLVPLEPRCSAQSPISVAEKRGAAKQPACAGSRYGVEDDNFLRSSICARLGIPKKRKGKQKGVLIAGTPVAVL